MSNGPYVVDETCLVFAKNIEKENERLEREAEIRLDQIRREQESHLRTIADYNRVAVENDKLRKALKAILNDAGYHNPMRMTTEISDKILEDAAGALDGYNF